MFEPLNLRDLGGVSIIMFYFLIRLIRELFSAIKKES